MINTYVKYFHDIKYLLREIYNNYDSVQFEGENLIFQNLHMQTSLETFDK